jgi:hypothetical protein
MTKFKQGFYKCANPSKYKGDPTRIVYRSGWERKLMFKLDQHPDIIEWSSEGVIVPYISPMDNKMHRYFIDFYVKYKQRDGTIRTLLIEVKPYAQTLPPVRKKHMKERRYITEVMTYGTNQKKWEAAKAFANKRGWCFEVWTEKELAIKF